MRFEPTRGIRNRKLKCAFLRKQVGCARYDLDCLRCGQARIGLLVELDHPVIEAADNQQCRCGHATQAQYPRGQAGLRGRQQRQYASRVAPLRPGLLPLPCSPRTSQAEEASAGSLSIQWTTSTSRPASSGISKTLERSRSSSGVSRSNNRVAIPRAFKALAAAILRGLNRLEPLPWANTTSALAEAGK